MFLKRLALIGLAAGVGLGTAGCTEGYGYTGLDVGYGAPGYGYGDGYYGAGYDGYGYGYPSGFGWYNDFYYPGSGIYVYDQYRRPYRWNDSQRRYWEGRRGSYRGDRDGNWAGFARNGDRGNPAYRGNGGNGGYLGQRGYGDRGYRGGDGGRGDYRRGDGGRGDYRRGDDGQANAIRQAPSGDARGWRGAAGAGMGTPRSQGGQGGWRGGGGHDGWRGGGHRSRP